MDGEEKEYLKGLLEIEFGLDDSKFGQASDEVRDIEMIILEDNVKIAIAEKDIVILKRNKETHKTRREQLIEQIEGRKRMIDML